MSLQLEYCGCDNPECSRYGYFEAWSSCPRQSCGGRMRPFADDDESESDETGQNGLATA